MESRRINHEFTSRFARMEGPNALVGKINDYDAFSAVYDQIMGEDCAEEIFLVHHRMLGQWYVVSSAAHLDLACGTGSYLRLLRENGHSGTLQGIDISQGQIVEAEKRSTDIQFSVDDVAKEDLETSSEFNYVTMNLDALNHIPPEQWDRVFENAHKALRFGGVFLFDVNTPERLSKDWQYPEVIVKPDFTYVQIPGKISRYEGCIGCDLHMEVYDRTGQMPPRAVLVRQYAVPDEEIQSKLAKAGFRTVEVFRPRDGIFDHPFMKNRDFYFAQK